MLPVISPNMKFLEELLKIPAAKTSIKKSSYLEFKKLSTKRCGRYLLYTMVVICFTPSDPSSPALRHSKKVEVARSSTPIAAGHAHEGSTARLRPRQTDRRRPHWSTEPSYRATCHRHRGSTRGLRPKFGDGLPIRRPYPVGGETGG